MPHVFDKKKRNPHLNGNRFRSAVSKKTFDSRHQISQNLFEGIAEVISMRSKTLKIQNCLLFSYCFLRFSADYLFKHSRLFANCATDLIPEISSDKLCSSLCVSRRGCKSFNFNSVVSICQLLMTDFLLNNASIGEFK